MDSLPPEVFENIFSRIASRKDLVALRSLNRFFNARFTASAFRGLDFYDPPKNPDRLPSVAHSHLAPYITHLLFNLDSVRLGHIVTESAMQATADTFSAIFAFYNTETITLVLPKYNNLQVRQQRAIIGSLPPLTPISLTISQLQPHMVRSLSINRLRDLLGGLRHLSIHLCPHHSGPDTVAHSSSFASTWLHPSLLRLETLRLQLSYRFVRPLFEGLVFPALKVLELSEVVFSGETAPDIVLGDNLQNLTLTRCAVSTGSWANIFRGLCGAKLKQVEVAIPLRYGIVDNWGWYRDVVQGRDNEADEEALNNLWERIGQEDRVPPGGSRPLDTIWSAFSGERSFLVFSWTECLRWSELEDFHAEKWICDSFDWGSFLGADSRITGVTPAEIS